MHRQAMWGSRCATGSSKYILSALLFTLGLALSLPSWSGVDGLEDEDNAKMARTKAQMNSMKAKSSKQRKDQGGDGSSGDEKCGNLEIGNVSNSRPGRPVREVTVVVDGPVINANNCR